MLGTFGTYRIEAELSRGGMGVVYRALDRTGTPVALKLLQAGGAFDVARFRREAEFLAQLQHPGIVGLRDFGHAQGQTYVVMDLVEGRSLGETLRASGPLEPNRAARLVAQAADALAHAHERGVIHRDLKPDNLIVRPDGQGVIIDFGLALFSDEEQHRLTLSGELLGTPHYMAPEQAQSARAADARADVYGLGATLFALVSGRPPYEGSSPLQVINRVVSSAPPTLSSVASHTPAWIDAVCQRCLARDPEQRYTSARDLAAALRQRPAAPASPRSLVFVASLLALLLLGGGGGWLLAGGFGGEGREPVVDPPADPPSDPPSDRRSTPAMDPAADPVPQPRSFTLELSPRCGRDTSLNGWALYCNDNSGADGTLTLGVRRERGQVGGRVILTAFPLDRLPTEAELLSAELILTPASVLDPPPVAAHQVLDPWIEGTSTHDDFVDGVAWGEASHSPLAKRYWRPSWRAEAAAQGALVDGRYVFDLTELVRAWRGGEENHGVCLQFPEFPLEDGMHYYAFYTRESADPEVRPLVRFRYLGPPPLPTPASRPIAPPLDREDLPALHAYLAQVPDDVELRLARARRYMVNYESYGQARQDLDTILSQVRDAHLGVSQLAMEMLAVSLQARARPDLPDHQRKRLPRPFSLLRIAWAALPPGSSREVLPSREVREETIIRCMILRRDVHSLVTLWERAQELWPDAPELRDEVPRVLLDVIQQEAIFFQPGNRPAQHMARIALEGILALDELDPALRQRAQDLLTQIPR